MLYPTKKYRLRIYLKDRVVQEYDKFFDTHNDCDIYIGQVLREQPKFCKYELYIRKNIDEEVLIESGIVD